MFEGRSNRRLSAWRLPIGRKRRGFALIATVGVLAVLALMMSGMVERAAIERKRLQIERRQTVEAIALANVVAALGTSTHAKGVRESALVQALGGACGIDPSVTGFGIAWRRDKRVDVNVASASDIAAALRREATGRPIAAMIEANASEIGRVLVRGRRVPFVHHAQIATVARTVLRPNDVDRGEVDSLVFDALTLARSGSLNSTVTASPQSVETVGMAALYHERDVLLDVVVRDVRGSVLLRSTFRRQSDVRIWRIQSLKEPSQAILDDAHYATHVDSNFSDGC